MIFKIENINYILLKNYKNIFNLEEFKKKYIEHLKKYEYICGDFSEDKMRLKGFTDDNIKKYIENSCVFDAPYFLVKKISDDLVEQYKNYNVDNIELKYKFRLEKELFNIDNLVLKESDTNKKNIVIDIKRILKSSF